MPRHKGDRPQARADRQAAGYVQIAPWIPIHTKEALERLATALGVTQSEALAFAIETAERRLPRQTQKKDPEGEGI